VLGRLPGATIDTTASLCHAPSIMAFQQAGESTSSLGEVRNRSDLVLFWGCDPVVSHPRHRNATPSIPSGEFIEEGANDRTVIVVDDHPTASSAQADLFIQVEPDRDFDVLWALRGMIRGIDIAAESSVGVPHDVLADLARRMKTCRSGVAFFGLA